MAGSFGHVSGPRRTFRMTLVENMRDAREALEEMHWLIWELADGDRARINKALKRYSALCRKAYPCGVPPGWQPKNGKEESR